MIVDPKSKPTWFITALDTVDDLHVNDIQSTHQTFNGPHGALEYARKRKRALRIYSCVCVDVVTAESRRQAKR